ncbi:MAG: hypothetical protein V1821_04200, partial [bacterium]
MFDESRSNPPGTLPPVGEERGYDCTPETTEREWHQVAEVVRALNELDRALLNKLESSPEELEKMLQRIREKDILRRGKIIKSVKRTGSESGKSESYTVLCARFNQEKADFVEDDTLYGLAKPADGDGFDLEMVLNESHDKYTLPEVWEARRSNLLAEWLAEGKIRKNSRGEYRYRVRHTLPLGKSWRGEVLVPAVAEIMGLSDLFPPTVVRPDPENNRPLSIQRLEPEVESYGLDGISQASDELL